jgi:Xaa-Pro aminopeptidase
LAKGQGSDVPMKESYRRFYMHSCSHWQGLDVHDGTCYQNEDGTPRLLAPGMILTAEPGIYIPDEEDIPKKYRGIGIRIEDDILITETGNEVLTSCAPKTVKEIEKMMVWNVPS